MRFNSILTTGLLVLLTAACASSKKSTSASSPTTPVAPAAAQAAAAAPEKKVEAPKNVGLSCKRGSEERTIEIEPVQPKGCKLWYAKLGQKNVVASSEIAQTHCEQVRDRIRGKLEAADFKCADGSVAQKSETKPKTAAPAQNVKSEVKKEVKTPPAEMKKEAKPEVAAPAKEAKAQPAPTAPSKDSKPAPAKTQPGTEKPAEKKS